METKPQTSKEYFKTLQIIYYALIAGQVSFGFVALLLHQILGFKGGGQDLRNILIYVVPILIIGGFLVSRIIFRKSTKVAISRISLIEKMSDYQAALIVRYALLEGSSFISIVVFLITGDFLFLGMAGLIIVIFFTMRPTKAQAVKDLELNPYDEQSILDPDKVISEIKTEK